MPESNVVDAPVSQSQAPAQTPVVPQLAPDMANRPASAPEPDLITKVSQFKRTQVKAPEVIQNAPEQPEFEVIKDPIAREAAKQATERMRRGMQSSYERQLNESKQIIEQSKNWSPERIQNELLSNPQFLAAAQQIQASQNPVNSGLTDEQFSALTPQEKAEIGTLKSEINSLKQVNYQAIVSQRDAQLQTRYPDYNPTQIDTVIRDLAQMNPLDIREHVYKSIKHDEDVAAAYELGLQESRQLNQNKIDAITPNGSMVATSDGLPVREKSDTDQAWFMKLASFRLAQFKNRK